MRNAMLALMSALLTGGNGYAEAGYRQVLTPVTGIIADEACSASKLPEGVVNARTASYAVLHDGGGCVIAFFRDLDDAPLEILRSTGQPTGWKYALLFVDDHDHGPIERIRTENDLIIVSTRYEPNLFANTILNSALARVGTIHGLFVRAWPSGLLQYEVPETRGPSFEQIVVFDPVSGIDRTIYPQGPCGDIRATYVRQRQEAQGGDRRLEDKCWTESHAIAPRFFDWRTNAFAFVDELFTNYDRPQGWDRRVQVMVICDRLDSIDRIDCRETPLTDWQTARPDLNLSQLVEFAASQPRFR